MEPRFNHDFSDVKVHNDANANRLSNSVNARAFTVGNDIFLGKNESSSDNGLMAHELTHVIQQNNSVIHRQESSEMSGSVPIESIEDARIFGWDDFFLQNSAYLEDIEKFTENYF